MNEVAGPIQQLRSYLIVAIVFLVIGIGIGMNIGDRESPPYEPPVYTELTTPDEGPDFTLAIFAGATGAVLVMVVGCIVIRRNTMSYELSNKECGFGPGPNSGFGGARPR